ncbi:MAG TPA: tRNA (adenosine(37)-N6)-threonylcarbamoyltransferase complex ATPase subunit type 1 TsaE [Candidatus Saccharimonadales bacterium]|nr:tRNA (adenosine(37)-N6)-threonylcarbamoyltransferase complex ATPase subunit type 1 TsaE [Candidatus Saccharimonadales bacterium]
MQKIITNTAEETKKFAKEFILHINSGEVITLSGELGAGKTTFVQGLAEGLGITNRIISPTFIIMRTYEIHSTSKILDLKTFYHVDLYRTSHENDIDGLGLPEILQDPHVITVIEWPERMGSRLPKKRWDLQIKNIEGDVREITYGYLSS